MSVSRADESDGEPKSEGRTEGMVKGCKERSLGSSDAECTAGPCSSELLNSIRTPNNPWVCDCCNACTVFKNYKGFHYLEPKLNLLFCQKPFSLVHYIAEVSRKVQCLVDSTFFGCDIAYFMAASAAAARSLS
jgi:hypothetical protein